MIRGLEWLMDNNTCHLLWFEYEMSHKGSCVWTLGAWLAAWFRKIVETLGGGALEKVCQWRWTLRFSSPIPPPGGSWLVKAMSRADLTLLPPCFICHRSVSVWKDCKPEWNLSSLILFFWGKYFIITESERN